MFAQVTGDQMVTALQVAKEVGIDADMVWAGVSPDEKQDIVKNMKMQGEIVAMVSPLLPSQSQLITRHTNPPLPRSATESTTPPRSPPQTSASPWRPAPT